MSSEYKFMSVGKCAVYICTKKLTGDYGSQVLEKIQSLMEENSKPAYRAVVLDLFNTVQLETDFINKAIPFVTELQNQDIEFYLIHAPEEVSQLIAKMGLESAILVKDSAEEINHLYKESKDGKAAPNLDLRFTNPFIDAVIHTMKTQVHVNPKPQKPKLKRNLLSPDTDVAATMKFLNDSFQFHIALVFSTEVACKIVEKMLDEKYTALNEDVVDCVAEILNIVFGQSKPQLTPFGFDIRGIRPSSHTGKDIEEITKKPLPTLGIPFQTELGVFEMEFAVEKLKQSA